MADSTFTIQLEMSRWTGLKCAAQIAIGIPWWVWVRAPLTVFWALARIAWNGLPKGSSIDVEWSRG